MAKSCFLKKSSICLRLTQSLEAAGTAGTNDREQNNLREKDRRYSLVFHVQRSPGRTRRGLARGRGCPGPAWPPVGLGAGHPRGAAGLPGFGLGTAGRARARPRGRPSCAPRPPRSTSPRPPGAQPRPPGIAPIPIPSAAPTCGPGGARGLLRLRSRKRARQDGVRLPPGAPWCPPPAGHLEARCFQTPCTVGVRLLL